MTSLWPNDIGVTDQNAPVTILRDQASLLGRQLRNVVKAEVKTKSTASSPILEWPSCDMDERSPNQLSLTHDSIEDEATKPTSSENFVYDFYIVGPLLENYRYRVFTISYDFRLYPVKFYLDRDIVKQFWSEKDQIIASSEAEFMSILMLIFSSDKMRQIINAIVIQSGAVDDQMTLIRAVIAECDRLSSDLPADPLNLIDPEIIVTSGGKEVHLAKIENRILAVVLSGEKVTSYILLDKSALVGIIGWSTPVWKKLLERLPLFREDIDSEARRIK